MLKLEVTPETMVWEALSTAREYLYAATDTKSRMSEESLLVLTLNQLDFVQLYLANHELRVNIKNMRSDIIRRDLSQARFTLEETIIDYAKMIAPAKICPALIASLRPPFPNQDSIKY